MVPTETKAPEVAVPTPVTVSENQQVNSELVERDILREVLHGVWEEGRRHELPDIEWVWIPGPLYWLQNFTRTFDEHWEKRRIYPPLQAYKRFPRKRYFPVIFSRLVTEPLLWIPKSREMMLSWALAGYASWAAQFHERVRAIFQSQKQEKSNELVTGRGSEGYVKTLYSRQDDWLQRRYPLASRLADMPADKFTWGHQSLVQGMAGGPDQVRSYHPTIFIMDEAAHIDGAEDSYNAAKPVADQIILTSSTAPSWFGDHTEL